MTTHDRLVALAPLCALGALQPAEIAEFAAHADDCLICRLELAEAMSVTAALTPDTPPPEKVWVRIAADIEPGAGNLQSSPARRAPASASTRLWMTLTTVAAGVALVLGVIAVGQRGRISDLMGDQGVVAAAEAASVESEAIVAELLVDEVSVARVVLTAGGEGFVVPTDHLVALDSSRTYQLWVVTSDDRVVSAGVLGNSPRPSTFTWAGEVSGFALTNEVAGGVVTSEGDLVALVTDA